MARLRSSPLRPLVCELAWAALSSGLTGLPSASIATPTTAFGVAVHGAEDGVRTRRETLNRLLRWCPWWSAGHVRFAQLSLDLNDVDAAFASAHAPFTLGASPKILRASKRVLGLCFMKRGAPERALAHFEEVWSSSTGTEQDETAEDVAAAAMALGNFTRAVEVLERIPEDRRSRAARTAYEFARGRLA